MAKDPGDYPARVTAAEEILRHEIGSLRDNLVKRHGIDYDTIDALSRGLQSLVAMCALAREVSRTDA